MGCVKMPYKPIDETPFCVGSVLLQRVPASSALYCARHGHWRGYLYPETAPIEVLEKAGKLIEVRSKREIDIERRLYHSQMKPGTDRRLAYYEVIDAGN